MSDTQATARIQIAQGLQRCKGVRFHQIYEDFLGKHRDLQAAAILEIVSASPPPHGRAAALGVRLVLEWQQSDRLQRMGNLIDELRNKQPSSYFAMLGLLTAAELDFIAQESTALLLSFWSSDGGFFALDRIAGGNECKSLLRAAYSDRNTNAGEFLADLREHKPTLYWGVIFLAQTIEQ